MSSASSIGLSNAPNKCNTVKLRKLAGFACIYVIATKLRDQPTKVGMTDNVVARLGGIQSGNWNRLYIVDFWWLAGKEITEKLEAAIFERLGPDRRLCGEWFNLPAKRVVPVAEALIRESGYPFLKEWELTRAEQSLTDDQAYWAYNGALVDFDFETKRYVVRNHN